MARGKSRRSIVRTVFIYALNLFCELLLRHLTFIALYAGPIHIQCSSQHPVCSEKLYLTDCDVVRMIEVLLRSWDHKLIVGMYHVGTENNH